MIPSEITVRETTPADLAAIVEVQKAAFGSDNEAGLTAKLLADPSAGPVVSLLALRGAEPVGHILFTRCRVENSGAEQPMLHILAPLAVVPACQKQGIGGRLIADGLELLRRRGTRLVYVLGHKTYYPRHGFIAGAEKLGFPTPYPIAEEFADYWMVQPLTEEGFTAPKGRIRCADTLDRPEYWRE